MVALRGLVGPLALVAVAGLQLAVPAEAVLRAAHLRLFSAAHGGGVFGRLPHPEHAHGVVVAFGDASHAEDAQVVCTSGAMAGEALRRIHDAHQARLGEERGVRLADRMTRHAQKHIDRAHGGGWAAVVWHMGADADDRHRMHGHGGASSTWGGGGLSGGADHNHTEALLGLLDEEEDWNEDEGEAAAGFGELAGHVHDGAVEDHLDRGGLDGGAEPHRRAAVSSVLGAVRRRGARRAPSHGAACVEVEVRWGGGQTRRMAVADLGSAAVHAVSPDSATPGQVVRDAHASLLQEAERVSSAAGDGASAAVAAGARAAATAAVYLSHRVPGLDQVMKPIAGMVLDPLVGQVIDMVGGRLREGGAANVNHAVDGKAPPMIAAALRVGVGADVVAAVPDAVAAGVTAVLPGLLASLATQRSAELVDATSDAIVAQLVSDSTMARRRSARGPAGLVGADARQEASAAPADRRAGWDREDAEAGPESWPLPSDVESRMDDAMGVHGASGMGPGAAAESGPRRPGSRAPSEGVSAGEWAGDNGLDGNGDTAAPARARDFVAAALGVETVPTRSVGQKEPVRPPDGEPLGGGTASLLQAGAAGARVAGRYAGDPRTRTDTDPAPPSALPGVRIRGRLEDVVVEAVSRTMAMRLERLLARALVPRVTYAASLGVVAGVTRAAGGPWPSSAETHKLDCELCEGHGDEGGACRRCRGATADGSEADQYSSYYAGHYGAYYAEYYARYYGEAMRGLDRINAFREWRALPPWGPRWFASRCASRKAEGAYGGSEGEVDVACKDEDGGEDALRSEGAWTKTLPEEMQAPSAQPPADASMWRGEGPATMPPLEPSEDE